MSNKTLTSPSINSPVLNSGDALTATSTELNFVDGVTSAIQTQIDGKASPGKAVALAIVFGG
jgi:hypothetical protein